MTRASGKRCLVGLAGNCAEVLPELVRRGVRIDAVTDQTSAHDPLNGYVPAGLSIGSCCRAASRRSPRSYVRAIDAVDGPRTSRRCSNLKRRGRGGVLTTATTFARWRYDAGCAKTHLRFPASCRIHPPALLRRQRSVFGWVALSGDAVRHKKNRRPRARTVSA